MNFTTLIESVAERTGLTKAKTEEVIRTTFGEIGGVQQLGDSVRIPSFGTFSVRDRAAGEGRNPRTGEKLQIAARRVATFSASKMLKESLNPPPPALRRKRA